MIKLDSWLVLLLIFGSVGYATQTNYIWQSNEPKLIRHELKPGDPCYDPNSTLPNHNLGTDSCEEYEYGIPVSESR